jgi:acetaldehyde dehydrogenase/alcohol dehydrogenase
MNHSMAHKIGAGFHVPHGLAHAVLLPYSIRYNGTKPEKPGLWPKYTYYNADLRYCELAKAIGLEVTSLEQGVEAFAQAVWQLGTDCNITMNFSSLPYLNEADWMAASEKLAYLAYEDQCSPANPRVPMVADMKEILEKSWSGEVIKYVHR